MLDRLVSALGRSRLPPRADEPTEPSVFETEGEVYSLLPQPLYPGGPAAVELVTPGGLDIYTRV